MRRSGGTRSLSVSPVDSHILPPCIKGQHAMRDCGNDLPFWDLLLEVYTPPSHTTQPLVHARHGTAQHGAARRDERLRQRPRPCRTLLLHIPCAYVCVRARMCACVHARTHTCTHACTCVCARMRACVRTCVCVCLCQHCFCVRRRNLEVGEDFVLVQYYAIA